MLFNSYDHSCSPGSVCGACLHRWRSAIDDFQRERLLPFDTPEAWTAQSDDLRPAPANAGMLRTRPTRLFGSAPIPAFNCIGPRP